jgi:hypothetical protein
MRRPVAAVIAALAMAAVLTLAGCGGGSTPEAPASGGTAAGGSAATPPKPPTGVSTSTADLSVKAITTPRAFPAVEAQTAPKAVLDALAAKRAFIIVFYDSSQTSTADQKVVIDGLAKKFRGLIDFITFDLTTLARAPEGSESKNTARLAAQLAQKLDLGYQPAIVITDQNGQITWQSTGYYDAGTLEREILRATQ